MDQAEEARTVAAHRAAEEAIPVVEVVTPVEGVAAIPAEEVEATPAVGEVAAVGPAQVVAVEVGTTNPAEPSRCWKRKLETDQGTGGARREIAFSQEHNSTEI
jgi:hypothetical protein